MIVTMYIMYYKKCSNYDKFVLIVFFATISIGTDNTMRHSNDIIYLFIFIFFSHSTNNNRSGMNSNTDNHLLFLVSIFFLSLIHFGKNFATTFWSGKILNENLILKKGNVCIINNLHIWSFIHSLRVAKIYYIYNRKFLNEKE